MYMANQPLKICSGICFPLHKFGQCSVERCNAKFAPANPSLPWAFTACDKYIIKCWGNWKSPEVHVKLQSNIFITPVR